MAVRKPTPAEQWAINAKARKEFNRLRLYERLDTVDLIGNPILDYNESSLYSVRLFEVCNEIVLVRFYYKDGKPHTCRMLEYSQIVNVLKPLRLTVI